MLCNVNMQDGLSTATHTHTHTHTTGFIITCGIIVYEVYFKRIERNPIYGVFDGVYDVNRPPPLRMSFLWSSLYCHCRIIAGSQQQF